MPTPLSQKLFNAAFHALPESDQVEGEQHVRRGNLTFREVVAKGYADVATVDEWVECWHKGQIAGTLRDSLGLDPEQYALWMREPDSLAASIAESSRVFAVNEPIPMSYWSKDHWSTFAYIESVMVECAGFQVGTDARMKTGRRHWQVLAEGCAHPKRPSGPSNSLSLVMRDEQSTKLKNGERVIGHDDWSCVRDMAAAGLFAQSPTDIEPGIVLTLSAKGTEIANALREFKRNNGQFAQFRWPVLSGPTNATPVRD